MRCETRAADPMLQAVESRQLPVIFVVVVVTFAVIVRCVVQLLKKKTHQAAVDEIDFVYVM